MLGQMLTIPKICSEALFEALDCKLDHLKLPLKDKAFSLQFVKLLSEPVLVCLFFSGFLAEVFQTVTLANTNMLEAGTFSHQNWKASGFNDNIFLAV